MVSSLTQITAEFIIKENIAVDDISHVTDIINNIKKDKWLKSKTRVWYVPFKFLSLTDEEVKIVYRNYQGQLNFNQPCPLDYDFSQKVDDGSRLREHHEYHDLGRFGDAALQVLLNNNVKVNVGDIIHIPAIYNSMHIVNGDNTATYITTNPNEAGYREYAKKCITKYPPGYFCWEDNNKCFIDNDLLKECFYRSEFVDGEDAFISGSLEYYHVIARSTLSYEYSFGTITYTIFYDLHSPHIEFPPKIEHARYCSRPGDCHFLSSAESLVEEIGNNLGNNPIILEEIKRNPYTTILCEYYY